MSFARRLLPSLLSLALLTSCGAATHAAPPVMPSDAAAGASAKSSSQPAASQLLRFAEVEKGKLYRGGLPSKEDLQRLVAMGVKTDISLMGEVPLYDTFYVARERRWAKELGLKFIQVKVPTNSFPFTHKISTQVADAFLQAAGDPANQPCYFHCLHGRDRTGTMAAVYRIARNGYSNEQAFTEMLSFGFSSHDYPGLAAFVKQYRPASAAPL